MANVLSTAKRASIISALVEGNSIRGTARMVGCSKDTVSKLLVDLGDACADYLNDTLRDLPCKRIQADEIWSFVYAKQKNVSPAREGIFGYGDVWTFTALDADTKLCVSFLVGPRDAETATRFMKDVASRLSNRVQLTTDGHRMYLYAVEEAFGADVDFAQIVKMYGSDPADERRYSPAVCIGAEKNPMTGDPDPEHISTSYVERSNLTMRMSMRRFTRLTNAFSKKLENHVAAIALYAVHYNFVRIHQTLRVTPAMAAGVAKTPWKMEQIVGLLG